MDKFSITGTSRVMKGEVSISGSKNASLPMVIASLLTKDKVIIRNIPNLSDVSTLLELIETLGSEFELKNENNSSYKLIIQTKKIKNNLGPADVVIHNAPSASRGSILKLNPDDLELNFRVNTTALLHLVRETLPSMLSKKKGSILITGNTAATRGKSHWGFFASTKAAQRILAESIAREFGPKGIHVAYFIIDAAIDTPRTRPYMQPDKPDDYFSKPTAIAEEMYKTVLQDKSTWSFRVELRPFGETW